MSDNIMLMIGDNGKCTLYDDTYDITIHCESKEEHDEAMRLLKNVPPERKKGKWILVEESIKVAAYKCSECGRNVWNDMGYDVVKDYPFCHCGADMRGEQE